MSRSSTDIPTTLTEENEFGVPMTKLYLTVSEVGLVMMASLPVFMCAAIFTGGVNLISMAVLLAYFFVAANAMDSLRKGKPSSWIWDYRYQFGMVPEQRGWMRCIPAVKERILSSSHRTALHKFLGQKKFGDLMVADTYARVIMPPGGGRDKPCVAWQPLTTRRATAAIQCDHQAIASTDLLPDEPPKNRRLIRPVRKGGFPAPVWFTAPDGFTKNALGYEELVNIHLPWACVHQPAPIGQQGMCKHDDPRVAAKAVA